MKYALLAAVVLLSMRPLGATAQDEKEQVWVTVDAVKGDDLNEPSSYESILASRCRREVRDLGYTAPIGTNSFEEIDLRRPYWVMDLSVFEVEEHGFLATIYAFRSHPKYTNNMQAFIGAITLQAPPDDPAYLCQVAASRFDNFRNEQLLLEAIME